MKEPPPPLLSAGATEEPPPLLGCLPANEDINLVGHRALGGIAEEVVASPMVAEHVG
jgi:hypothetical protein